jgi:cytochrome c peroxidase
MSGLRWGVGVAAVVLAAAVLVVEGGIAGGAPAASADAGLLKDAEEVFQPLPETAATAEFPVTPERVELGRKLFFDPRISVDGTVACVRCHLPALYGTDGLPKAHGNHDKPNPRNAPTILNVALQFKAHWRGDRENVEDQAKQSLIGPAAFGNADYAAAMARLKAIPTYPDLFRKAFPGEPDPVTPENWGRAIGAYERTLLTPSRFDDFLNGKEDALSAAEQRGLRKFIDAGCVACHNGPDVGGGMFQKFGVTGDYWKETGSKDVDKGRSDVTHKPEDLYVFKVPGLRNVAMTPPYFHDGSVATLPEAVRIMAKLEIGTELSESDNADIVAFLGSLTGKVPQLFAEAPVLPPSGFADMKPATGDKAAR